MSLQALKIVKEELEQAIERNGEARGIAYIAVSDVLDTLYARITRRIEKECIEQATLCEYCGKEPVASPLRILFRNSDEDMDLCNSCVTTLRAAGATVYEPAADDVDEDRRLIDFCDRHEDDIPF